MTDMMGRVRMPQESRSCKGGRRGAGVGEGVGLAMAKLPLYSTPGQPVPKFFAEDSHLIMVQHGPGPRQLLSKVIWLAEDVRWLSGSGTNPSAHGRRAQEPPDAAYTVSSAS